MEKVDNVNGIITVSLAETDYQGKVKKELKQIGMRYPEKGFRPGHVPAGLLQKKYGKEVLVEVVNREIYDALMNHIRDNKLNVLGEPMIANADEVDFDRDVLDEARRYYANIVGKYGAQVQAVLQKAAGLDVQMLLPLHGHVWRRDLGYILGKYDLWSRFEPETQGVMIAYASVYGNTENAANILACRLAERGVKVKMYDVSVTPSSYVVSDAFCYSHLVFAAPTYNGGVFITMDELLRDIASHGLQNRRFALLENGTWAPVTARQMAALIEPLKGWQQVGAPVTIRSAAHEAQMQAVEQLAAAISGDISGENQ